VRKFLGAKVPGPIRSGERKFQGARRPGSERARERIGQGPIGRFAPGSELARERKGCESWTLVPKGCQSTRHKVNSSQPKIVWRVDRCLKRRAGTAVTSWPHVAVGVDSSALFNSPNTYDIPPLSMVLEILCEGDCDSS